MRFIIEFVSCCMCPNLSRQQQVEETTSLVAVKEPVSYVADPPRMMRRKRLRSSSSAVGVWQPSLSAILEDEDHQKGKIKIERNRTCGGGRRSGYRGRARSYHDYDYGRASYSNVMVPAFVPAPYAF